MRYIDAEALIKKIYPMGIGDGKYTINAKAVKLAIDNAPTADVVPKSEVDKTIAEWAYLHADVLNKLETSRAEVARAIFEEIEREIKNHGITYAKRKIAELKKKYTEEKQ